MSHLSYIVFSAVTIAATLAGGWMGVSLYRNGKRSAGIIILAAPFMCAMGPMLLLDMLRPDESLKSSTFLLHLPFVGFVMLPIITLAALWFSKSVLKLSGGAHG